MHLLWSLLFTRKRWKIKRWRIINSAYGNFIHIFTSNRKSDYPRNIQEIMEGRVHEIFYPFFICDILNWYNNGIVGVSIKVKSQNNFPLENNRILDLLRALRRLVLYSSREDYSFKSFTTTYFAVKWRDIFMRLQCIIPFNSYSESILYHKLML